MSRTLVIALLLAGLSVPASGQRTGQLPAVFDGVGIEEQLGGQLPLDLPFRDAEGREVLLGDYFDGEKPVLLTMVYHECPMLCSLMLTEFTKTVAELAATEGWVPGKEYEAVTVSFSAGEVPEMAARSKEKHLAQLGIPEAASGWHFLTGTDASIDALSESLGFGYKWVEDSREYAHPAALIFSSGTGVITRYIQGMMFPARDVRLATVEASEGKVGTTLDKIFLFCYRYDSEANSYVADAWKMMRAGGLLTLVLLGGTLMFYWRRERRSLTPAVGA